MFIYLLVSDKKESCKGRGWKDGAGETLKEQSAALGLRTLSAFTCTVWQQCNSKFYTVWDTN